MTYAQGKKHIKTLEEHGACLYDGRTSAPITVDFFKRAVAMMRKNKIQATTYTMRIPETDEMMGVRITSSGHVDSGSLETVMGL